MKYKLDEQQNDFLVTLLSDLCYGNSGLELMDYGHSNEPGAVRGHVCGSVHYEWFAEQRAYGKRYTECTKHLFLACGYSELDYKVLRSLAKKGGPVKSLSYDDMCFHMHIDLSVWKDVVFPNDMVHTNNKVAEKFTLPKKCRHQDEQRAIDSIVHKKDDFFGEWYEYRARGVRLQRTRDFDAMLQIVADDIDRFDYDRQCKK